MLSGAHLQCEGAGGGSGAANMRIETVSRNPHCQEGNEVTRRSVGVTYGGREVPLMQGAASRVPNGEKEPGRARTIQQRPRHMPRLRSREKLVEQHDNPGARAQATPPVRPGGCLDSVPGVQGNQQSSYAGRSSSFHMWTLPWLSALTAWRKGSRNSGQRGRRPGRGCG